MQGWVATACGPVRSANEDAARVAAWPGGGVAVAADGMGSVGHTEVAGIVADAICAFYREASPATRAALPSVQAAAQRGRAQIRAHAPPDPGGCTVAMLVVEGRRGVVAWAGDCRVYRQRGRTFSLLTQDHSLIALMVEQGRVSAAEAASHPHRNIVLRSVTAREEGPDAALEAVALEVAAGDRFLLVTDGVWRPLELWTLQQHMRVPAARLPEAAAAIVAAAHAEDGSDNAAAAVAVVG